MCCGSPCQGRGHQCVGTAAAPEAHTVLFQTEPLPGTTSRLGHEDPQETRSGAEQRR